MKRRIISIIITLALCLSLCPTWAFAVEGESIPDEVELADEWKTDIETSIERYEEPDEEPAEPVPPEEGGDEDDTEQTEDSVASVTIGEEPATYYNTIDEAWTAACVAESATVTLLDNGRLRF